MTEPESGREYLLYVPSNYDRELAWPLIVVCHSSFPDTAGQQIRHWTKKAESRGFLVLAPRLSGVQGVIPPAAETQITRQRTDERRILDCIRHVRGGHNVSADRVFLYGWSGGALAALHTGLKHPDIFRAVSVLQPKFGEAFMADVQGAIDPYQPVIVDYSMTDAITGKHARHCVTWLRSHLANLHDDPIGPARAYEVDRCVDFFEEAARRQPWLHIRAGAPAASSAETKGQSASRLAVAFRLLGSYEPVRYEWDFGDGGTSPVPEPVHMFPQAGTYRVSLTATRPDGGKDTRTVDLDVPGLRIRQAPRVHGQD